MCFPVHHVGNEQPEIEQALLGGGLIKLAEPESQLSLRQFTLVRDYFLCQVALATATCPGTLNSGLVSDYETFRVSEGNHIIHVPKHKRTKYGPAMLGMDPEMQKEMAVFVQIRPAFANPDEDKLFLKDDGHGFLEGTIGRRVV